MKPCTCLIYDLMSRGCSCGAMAAERAGADVGALRSGLIDSDEESSESVAASYSSSLNGASSAASPVAVLSFSEIWPFGRKPT